MIRIIVDSGCDLTEDMKNGTIPVERIPLNLQIGDNHYVDDDSFDADVYLKDMESSEATPKTAAPSPELYLEAYKKEGSVFAITLSSRLSGSYNSAILAKQMYFDEMGEKFIHVIDSLGACVSETVIALKINECIKNNFSDMEALQAINKFMSETKVFFVLEKFDNLVKNGRMNPYVAKAASLFSIKAVCGADDGNIVMLDKARGYKKAIAKLVDIIQKEGLDFENRTLGISHVKCLEKALEFKEEILKKIKFKDVVICEGAGICTTYADRGAVIISF